MPEASPQPTRSSRPPREARPRGVLCPFCGEVSPDLKRCRGCRAHLDPLSRQASQNEMGPWAIRDALHPFRPGCSFETIRRLVAGGRIQSTTVIRGPTTRQCWSFAGRTPAVANLLGLCHNCQREVNPDAAACPACGAFFGHDADRQHLGLAPVHLLPGQASPELIASAAVPTPTARQRPTVEMAVRDSVPASSSDPDVNHIIAAAHRRLLRLRTGVGFLLILVVLMAAALTGAVTGWIPVAGRRMGPSQQMAPPPASPASRTPESKPSVVPAEPPRAAEGAPPTEEFSSPSESPPPPEAEPAPPADAPRSPSIEGRRALRDRVLAMLTAEPPDLPGARGACREAADAGLTADAQRWLRVMDDRASSVALRKLP